MATADSASLTLKYRQLASDQRLFQRLSSRSWPNAWIAIGAIAPAVACGLAVGLDTLAWGLFAGMLASLLLWVRYRTVLKPRDYELRVTRRGLEVEQEEILSITWWAARPRIEERRSHLVLKHKDFLITLIPKRGQAPHDLARLQQLVGQHSQPEPSIERDPAEGLQERQADAPVSHHATSTHDAASTHARSLRFTLDASDWNDAISEIKKLYPRQPEVRQLPWASRATLWIIMLAFIPTTLWWRPHVFLLLAAYMLSLLALNHWNFRRIRKRLLAEREATFRDMSVSSIASGLHFRSNLGETLVRWRGIRFFLEGRKFLQAVRNDLLVHPIPRRAFASEQDAEEFLTVCKSWLEVVREGSPPTGRPAAEETGNPYQAPGE